MKITLLVLALFYFQNGFGFIKVTLFKVINTQEIDSNSTNERRPSVPLMPHVAAVCTANNYIPKSDSNGLLQCSQLFDNGISVGINQDTGFVFNAVSWNGNLGYIPFNAVFKLAVNGYCSASSYVALSDERYKKDIKTILKPLEKIEKLGGYTYKWNENNPSGRKLEKFNQAGFLAQEVMEVLPEAVIKTDEGTYGLIYDAIMPLLVEGIKEQQKIIKNQEERIVRLEALIGQDQRVSTLTLSIELSELNIIPNPITGNSRIQYTLINIMASSSIVITDMQGKIIKKLPIANNSKTGSVEISNLDFPQSGIYLFSLLSNNEEVQSKKIFVNK